MIKTSRQLKDLIRNLSKEKKAEAQILMRNFMMERFLERISLSDYRDKFILKGGMLVAAMVGLDARATMDLDATVTGFDVNAGNIEDIVKDIISVPVDDGVIFSIVQISEIMDEAEYPGLRISMKASFDGALIPLKIDISTGDAITPRAIRYNFKLMFEDRRIEVFAYNLETVLAEKVETIIRRATLNTRMRDFYDIYILNQLYGDTLDYELFGKAINATAQKRESTHFLSDAFDIFEEIYHSEEMQKMWISYQKKFSYARDISWEEVMQSVFELYNKIR